MADAFRNNDRQVLKENRVIELEEYAPHDDGVHTYISIKFPLSDEHGNQYGVGGISTDITERKLAVAELTESQARFSSIVEMAADAIISIDEEQKVILFNRAAEKMFGYSQLDMLGEQVDKLMPERYRQSHRGEVGAFLMVDSTDSINRKRGMFGLRRSGEEFRMETTISKQVLDKNRTIMTVMIRDINDQLDAEESQRKLLKAISEAGEAVLITDRNAVIEYVNPAFTEITGYLPEEIIGETPAILKSTAQDPVFYKELWDTITRGEVWHGTLIDKKKDGSFYPAMMSVAPIHDDEGEITHYVALQQDVTEHKRLEQQFLQAQKMESIGTLVGGIAHDFNNILAAVMGNIHLARLKKSDASAVSDKLENIERLSNRAAEMIRQCLRFPVMTW